MAAPPEGAAAMGGPAKADDAPHDGRGVAGGSVGTALAALATKEQFAEVWTSFMASRHLDASPALFNRAPLDLHKLFKAVMRAGGYETVLAQKGWARVGRTFNPPPSMTDLSYQIKKIYASKLLVFEKAYTAGELGATISLDSAPAAAAAVSTTSSGGAATGGRSKRARQADQPAQQQEELLEEVAAATPAEVELLPPSAMAQQQPQLPRPSSRGHSRRRVTQAALRSLSTGQTAGQAPPCSGTQQMSLPAGAGQVDQAATAVAPAAPSCLNLAAHEGAAPAGSAALQRQPASPRHLAGEQHIGATYPTSSHEAGVQPSPPPTPAFLRSTRPAAVASPWEMVGRRIGIWWADDGCFYTCTVTGYDTGSFKHALTYDDGAREWLHLGYEHWCFIDGFHAEPSPRPPAQQQQQQQQQPQAQAAGWTASQQRQQHGPVTAHSTEQGPSQEAEADSMPCPTLPGSSVGAPAGLAPPRRAHTATLTHQPPAAGSSPHTLPALPPAGTSNQPGTPAAVFKASQASQAGQQQQQQQQLRYQDQDLDSLPPRPSASSAGQPLCPQHGTPTRPPHFQYPAVHVPAALPVLKPSAAVPLVPRHQEPQELVASGRNFRAFTASSPSGLDGFEIFALLPGLSLDEISVRCWSDGHVRIDARPRNVVAAPGAAAAGGAAPASLALCMPSRIDTGSARGLFTAAGQLYLRLSKMQ